MYFRRAASVAIVPTAQARTPVQSLDCRVLLVEDNDAVAQATRELLESLGCATRHVATAVAAREYIDRNASIVDLVLTDIEMPGELDGIALAALLRVSHPHLPVVLMTGYAGRLEQAVQQRFEVLPKPCSSEMLAAAIGRALARHRSASINSSA